jgi:hypothetical protein
MIIYTLPRNRWRDGRERAKGKKGMGMDISNSFPTSIVNFLIV